MTKQEFKALTERHFTDEEYKVIETVYTFHPSISNVHGKKEIAQLYDMFGFRVIADMLPTAMEAKRYENLIMEKRIELEELQKEFQNLKRPRIMTKIA